MKKPVQTISIFVAIALSTQLCCRQQPPQDDCPTHNIFLVNKEHDKRVPSHPRFKAKVMFAMGNLFNLKVYHCGLKKLKKNYAIPTKQCLINDVRSHPFFINDIDGWDRRSSCHAPVVIFERKKGHFYLAFQGIFRHFTINAYPEKAMTLASIDNGGDGYYPSLAALIGCTQA